MSSFKKSMENVMIEMAGSLLRPFVKYAIENAELFGDEPDEDKLVSKMASELKLPDDTSAKSARSSTKSGSKVSDTVKGLGASKAGSKSNKKSSKKEDSPWLSKSDFVALMEENPDEDYCSYVPPRGQHKEKFCGKIADHKNSSDTDHKHEFRCDSCKEKVGRGKKVLEEGDTAPSRSMKKKPINGITKRSGNRPADKKSKKKKDESSDEESSDSDEEKMEVINNDYLTELLGNGYYLFPIENIGTTLVYTGEETNTVYGKFKGEVNDTTKITAATIAALQKINSSKIDKTFISSNDLVFADPKELDFNNESKKGDSSAEEKPKNKSKGKKAESSEEEKKPKKGKVEESSESEAESSIEEKKKSKSKPPAKKTVKKDEEEKPKVKPKRKETKKDESSVEEKPKVKEESSDRAEEKPSKKEESSEEEKPSKKEVKKEELSDSVEEKPKVKPTKKTPPPIQEPIEVAETEEVLPITPAE
jgi:nucleolin